ncbi:Uncharacterised protein [Pseudomonas luteola]|uniref:Uncharacterized protein n=1 Tax=Pseudomonas luteola TaxID=47886 RepID=A0A2X2BYS0_PSELU|nr:Uncharacterised protein [Pseudomonas luteola]
MYSIGHLLKAAPLTLAIAWAAPALALNPNSAEIGINSSIKSMNVHDQPGRLGLCSRPAMGYNGWGVFRRSGRRLR